MNRPLDGYAYLSSCAGRPIREPPGTESVPPGQWRVSYLGGMTKVSVSQWSPRAYQIGEQSKSQRDFFVVRIREVDVVGAEVQLGLGKQIVDRVEPPL